MIKPKEILALIVALIVLTFSYTFINPQLFIPTLLAFTLILIVYVSSKKLAAHYYEANEEIKIWTFKRFGLAEKNYLCYPIPIGIILPFLLSILTFGLMKWFAVLESEISPKEIRAVKRHDFYSFSEMTEWNLALISSAGIFSCFLLSFLSYLINLPLLSRLGIYFAVFNLIPLGKLDGARIFFGSKPLYVTLLLISLLGLSYAFLLI